MVRLARPLLGQFRPNPKQKMLGFIPRAKGMMMGDGGKRGKFSRKSGQPAADLSNRQPPYERYSWYNIPNLRYL